MASASTTSAAVKSESEDHDFTDVDSKEEEREEDAEWVDALFFPMKHVLDEYKSQDRKAMKETMIEDPAHKKLSSTFLENLKLQKMQYVSLYSDLKIVKDEIENNKTK